METVESEIVLLLVAADLGVSRELPLLLALERLVQMVRMAHFSRTSGKVVGEVPEESENTGVRLVMRPPPEDVVPLILEIPLSMAQEILQTLIPLVEQQTSCRVALVVQKLPLLVDCPPFTDSRKVEPLTGIPE